MSVSGKRVIVRIDADVKINADGQVDEGGQFRLFGCTDTLIDLHRKGAKIILLTHIGRPDGKNEENLKTLNVAKKLAEHLEFPIKYVPDIAGVVAAREIEQLSDGEAIFLENVRFDPREEQNDSRFAGELARLGDIYVNEAFASSHRAHASVAAITEFLPSYAGYLFLKEVNALETVLVNPERPVLAIVSGAKLETKAALLRNLLPHVDFLLTGGGIANMFIQAQGIEIGKSISDSSMTSLVAEIWETYKEKIFTPNDVKVLRRDVKTGEEKPLILSVEAVTDQDSIYDIGPMTIERYLNIVSMAKTCVWNGPLGKVELTEFQNGTKTIAQGLRATDCYTIIGGGDTVAFLVQIDYLKGFDHVSTGGGAMIAFLEGEKLPGVEALKI